MTHRHWSRHRQKVAASRWGKDNLPIHLLRVSQLAAAISRIFLLRVGRVLADCDTSRVAAVC